MRSDQAHGQTMNIVVPWFVVQVHMYTHIYIHIQGDPGGMCQTSGGCSLTLKRPPEVKFDPSLRFLSMTFLVYLTMTLNFVTLSRQVSSRSA